MKLLVETHILQNFAPANLNRDDMGSPKDAFFGGYRRGRISSQSLKRAMRRYVDAEGLVPKENLGDRTKRVVARLAEALGELGHAEGEARELASNALRTMGTSKKFNLKTVKSDEREELLTDYLVFLARNEVRGLASVIHEHAESLKGAKPKEDKKLQQALHGALEGGRAVDIALFGRMLANLPDHNQDAACQVAHALGTHAVEREFDYFTAVDDFRPDDTSGADMIGTVEFNSSCFYRYAVIDVAKLIANLDGEEDLALQGIEAFLRASAYALPSGKQNTFAAHNPPSFMALVVRTNASPRSLANAFAKPVDVRREANGDLLAASVDRLADRWRRLDEAYGQGGQAYYLDLTGATGLEAIPAEASANVEDLISGTLAAVRSGLVG